MKLRSLSCLAGGFNLAHHPKPILPAGQFQLLQWCVIYPDLACGGGVEVRQQVGNVALTGASICPLGNVKEIPLRAGGSSGRYCRPTSSKRIQRSSFANGVPSRRRNFLPAGERILFFLLAAVFGKSI